MFYTIIAILISVTIHEFAHAWAADRLGDPTAKFSGRLSLNPLAHLDILGTISLFLLGFGWGKPVPVDEYNLQDPKRDGALISLAGPVSNFILAIIISLLLKTVDIPLIYPFGVTLTAINVGLGLFNLLPVFPLDGSKILIGLLPFEQSQQVEDFLKRYGRVLLLILIFPIFGRTSLVSIILSPLLNTIMQLLI